MLLRSDGIFSVIDLGTNTCLLLIAAISQNELTKIYEVQKSPRLGKDLYQTGKISTDKFDLVTDIFKKYISVSQQHGSERILAFGTSACGKQK